MRQKGSQRLSERHQPKQPPLAGRPTHSMAVVETESPARSRAPVRRGVRRVIRPVAIAGIGLLCILVATGLVAWVATPSVDDLQTRVETMARERHSELLGPDQVPPLLASGLVATEDERFFEHHGIDVIGLGRALTYDVTHLCACQGGSTITEQLVKEVYLGGSDAGPAKMADMALALKVELHYSKAQILADYVSLVLVGYGRYGMANGACAYFGRPLAGIDLAQAALLAGMPQAPSAYDPLLHPDAAAARRAQVLDAMVDTGRVSSADAAAAEREPVATSDPHASCLSK